MEFASDDLLRAILSALRVVRGPDHRGEYVAWCPFHRDGQGTPPHEPNLSVSVRGYFCHACGAKGSLSKLAGELQVPVDRAQDDREVAYPYHDESGRMLFEVVRLSGKRFRQRRVDEAGKRSWGIEGVRRVPYRLPELLGGSDACVFIPEGEKDVDRLRREGLTATTNPGGAGKWKKEYSQFLKDRDVVILPDNDDPGRQHAQQVAIRLHGIARCVKVLSLPDLPEKGDVSDWLATGHTASELLDLAGAAPAWHPPSVSKEGTVKQSKPRAERGADVLVRTAEATGLELFHDQRGDPFAAVPFEGGRLTLSIQGREFNRWISHLGWKGLGRTFGSEARTSAREILAAKACFEGPQRHLHIRYAFHDGDIWVDLDGVRSIRVEPGKWGIVENPPILFRSLPHQRPIPLPQPGGDPWQLVTMVNLKDEDARLLLMCYLVAAMVPEIPVAALVLHGVQGSAKTTLLKMVKRLLDPSAVEVRGGVRDLTEYAQAAAQSRALFFDNLTSVPDWLSDALCRTVTGEGWSKRMLYTDEDTAVFEFRCAVGLAGINLIADRPDLLDRSLILPLEPISPELRRPDRELWSRFEAARPTILGGLLDALARAIVIEPTLRMDRLPRLADFARWGAAAADALGAKSADFLKAYERNVGRQNEAAIDASPVAQVLLALLKEREEWQGEPSDLYRDMSDKAESLKVSVRDKSWPKSANWLTRRLREVRPNLLALGIEITDDRTGDERSMVIRRVSGNGVIGVTSVIGVADSPLTDDGIVTASRDSVTDSVMGNPLLLNGNDGSDANDGISEHALEGGLVGGA